MRKLNSAIRAFFAPLSLLPEVILFAVAIYLSVRFTVRDLYVVSRYVFYLPTPVFAAACVVGIAFRLLQRRRKWVALATVVALALLIFCIFRSEFNFGNTGATAAVEGERLKIVTWNINAGHAGWKKVAERIRRENPDIVMLVEAYISKAPDGMQVWAKEFPGYNVANKNGPMTVLAKGKVAVKRFDEIRPASFVVSRYLCAEAEVDGKSLNLILFHPTPAFGRDSRGIFKRLVELIDEGGDDGPLILSGDFNAPPDSAYLDGIEERLRSAFKIAGRGFAYSWPAYLPLFAIDHTFVNRRVEVMDYRIERTNLSDHCIQIMEISLR